MKYLCTLGYLILLFFTACYQEEPNKYSESNSQFSFTKTEVKNGVSFSWDESKVSSFVEYILTKNVQSTPAVKSLSDIKASTIFARVKNRHEIQIKDTITIEKSYYRLYINIGHQLLASDEIFHDFNNYFLSSPIFTNILVDHVNGNLYIFSSPFRSIEIVDLKNLKLKLVKSSLNFNFNATPSLGYDQFGRTQLYMPLDDKIIFLDGENLQAKDTISSIAKGVVIYNTVSDKYSNIYYTDSYGAFFSAVSKYIVALDKTIRIGDVNSLFRNLRVTCDGKYIIVGTSSLTSDISLYTMDDKNNVVATTRSKGVIDWQSNSAFSMASISPTIISNGGFLYKDQFMQKVSLGQSTIFSTFSNDDEHIFLISSNQKIIFKVENKIPYKRLATYQTRFLPSVIFIYNNEIYSIGSSIDQLTGSTKVLVEKIKP
jgi:hypothetical protein